MPLVKMVYTGSRYIGLANQPGKKLARRWVVLAEDGSLTGKEMFFTEAKRHSPFSGIIGDVSEFDIDENKNAKHQGRCKPFADRATVSAWNLDERHDATEHALATRKDDGFGNLTADELAKRYAKLIGSAKRAAFIAAVIQHVTK